ncbi:MAG: hypothetical protein C4523_03680 [Myxococcales bacterium]|nr:MAG: hypothetical protein C4523_03680 [Myxococcales bacterium]
MTKKLAFVLAMTMLAGLAFVAGCDSVSDFTEADENVPCGRYCIKCGDCKDQGEGYVKELLDYTCAIDELGMVCQEACDAGSIIDQADFGANVEAAEAEFGMKVTDPKFTCEEFGLATVTGEVEGPCLRFCAKCVECSGQVSSAAADWCAKEGGLPCVEACVNGFEDYVQTFEDMAKENTEGIETISDVDCTDWEATLEKTGDVPEF